MNESTIKDASAAASDCCAEVDQCVRQNPISAILVAVGVGVGITLLVRALRPEPTPRDRVERILEDIQDRLRGTTGPLLRKARALASDGLEAAHGGEAQIEGFVSDVSRRVRRLFS